MNKYDKLDKLQKLKDNGVINEEEFETEKKKIIEDTEVPNNIKDKKNKMSIICFIVSGLLLVITIAFIMFNISWSEKDDDAYWDYLTAKSSYEDYEDTKYRYRALYEDAREEFKDAEDEYEEVHKTYSFYKYGSYIIGAMAVISFGTGIMFLEIKKKNKRRKNEQKNSKN